MKKLSVILGSSMLSLSLFGQEITLNQNNDQSISINHELTLGTPSSIVINNENYLNYSSLTRILSAEVGAPSLPYFAESVLLPNTGDVSFEVVHDGYSEITNVQIAPSKGSLKRNVNPADVAFTFSEVYNNNSFYPGTLANVSSPFVLRETRGANVVFNPYQYNPVTKTLRVYHNLRLEISIDQNVEGINEIAESNVQKNEFSNVYANIYLNAERLNTRYTPKEETGSMLVICPTALTDEIQPLVDWKIQKGIPTTIVSTTETGSTASTVKAYIQSYYATNPDLLYILLVGDHGDIPAHTYGNSGGEQLYSDSYYAQLAGGSNDYYIDAFIGRFSGNSAQVTTMVNRTLEYEKNPASGTWMTNAIGLASSEGSGYGDDGEADWQHARNIRTQLLGFGYNTVHEFYDGSQGGSDASGSPSASTVQTALTQGVGLFNYTGHGDQTSMVSGNFSTSNISAATNNGKYPFVISVACNNGTFTSGTCISEVWLRETDGSSPAGAIAAAGSSILMAWAEPMQTQDEMTSIITEAYANNKKTTLGGIFYNSQMSMLEDYNASGSSKEVMQTWILFGDPSTMFRNKVTSDLTVLHDGNVPLGTTSMTIDCDVDGALVCIVQNGVILGTGYASGGSVTITFTALTSDAPLIVTATMQNYGAYQHSVQVGNGSLGLDALFAENVQVYPIPASNQLNISWNSIAPNTHVELINLDGKVVAQENISGTGKLHQSVDVSKLTSGIYFINIINGDQKVTKRVIID
jgi:gingipain R